MRTRGLFGRKKFVAEGDPSTIVISIKFENDAGQDISSQIGIKEEKKVGLSIRAAGEEASRTEVETYKQPSSSTGSTIGELMS